MRVGDRILVSGTTATGPDGALLGGADPKAQMNAIIDKIEAAIESLGGSLRDVVRTRIYLAEKSYWRPVSEVHGERFAGINPANTLVQAGLIGDEYVVEMDAEAVVGAGDAL